jgi:hypothetical protein
VDEYEGAEDVGYTKRDVPDQHQFVRTELEVVDDDMEQLYAQQQPTAARSNSTGSSPSLESFEVGASSAAASPFSTDNVQGQATSQIEENWDEGPRDIKLADPVVTDPSPSVHGESPRRLSRVESLSNSFIDDNESADGGLSTRHSDTGSFDPEISDHIPPVTLAEQKLPPQQQEQQQEPEQQPEQQPEQHQPEQKPEQQQPEQQPEQLQQQDQQQQQQAQAPDIDASPTAGAAQQPRSHNSATSSADVVADIIGDSPSSNAKQESTPPSIKVASIANGWVAARGAATGCCSFAHDDNDVSC